MPAWPSVTYLRPATQQNQWLVTDLPEFAFLGRSNVGKSSLINRLAGQKLLRTSHSPGRTQMIHWLSLGQRAHLVDLPGYGYAKVSKSQQQILHAMIEQYILKRHNLTHLMLLLDSRRGLGPKDEYLLSTLLTLRPLAFVVVWTKWDTLDQRQKSIYPLAWPNDLPKPIAQIACSARQSFGLAELQRLILTWLPSHEI